MSVPTPSRDWFSFLKVRPYQRVTSYWANQLIDAVSLTYDIAYTLSRTNLSLINLQNLPVSIIPAVDDTIDLGAPDKRFKDLYVLSIYANYLKAQNINTVNLNAAEGDISTLNSDSATFGNINVNNYASIRNLMASSGFINDLSAINNNLEFINAIRLDANVVNANSANFNEVAVNGSLTVQGKPVLKDGDPINIAEFFDTALTQLAQVIYDAATIYFVNGVTTAVATGFPPNLIKIAVDDEGRVYALADVNSYEPTALTQLQDTISEALSPERYYLYEIDNRLYEVYQRLEGPLGVVIVNPVDQYGNVRTTVVDAFEPVYATKTVTSTENTSGVELVLSKGGRPNLNFYYSTSGPATIYVEVSVDGVTWRTLDTITLASAGSAIKTYSNLAYPYVRARTPTTGIDVTFELVASR